jgi:hypothetical protein
MSKRSLGQGHVFARTDRHLLGGVARNNETFYIDNNGTGAKKKIPVIEKNHSLK